MPLPAPATGRAALITGASSGIGIELARRLAGRGHDVVLTARREDRLRALAAEIADSSGVRAEVIPCDLASGEERDALAGRIDELGLEVSILANNAGYGSGGSFTRLDREREVDMVRLNCEAVVDLSARYTPAMAERGEGAVLIVASVAAFQPLPTQATYGASKAFALSLAEALHTELGPKGLTVTALCPGPVRTEFFDVAGIDAARKIPDLVWVTPEQCADAAVEGLERGRRVVIPGTPAKLSAYGGRWTPRPALLPLLGRVYRAGN